MFSKTQVARRAFQTEAGRAAAVRRRRRAILDPASDWETTALRRRWRAGFWAARVAFILSVPFAVVAWARSVDNAWLVYMLLPVLASFFSGALLGASILDSKRVTDTSLAGRQAVLVAIGAYLLFAAEIAVMSTTPLHSGLDYLMGSLLVSGWLVLPISFFAGVLAFRAREGSKKYRPRRERTASGMQPRVVA